MPASAASAFNPRQRLSIFTNSTLGHDVSAAFKASSGLTSRSSDANETPAPPPSPVDFCFPITPADSRRDGFMAARLAMSCDKTTTRGLHTSTLVNRTNSTHHVECLHAIMYLHPTPTSSANIFRSANLTQKLA
ncbi:hypothetical protein GT037_002085 [Alternaria burnsii]|uniref:Uncharacterized protein n=1 Tax=Alternaria burnsii TaxID=1187904 RepID=A0A8H7EJL1_9PLEO|nr:uncharacterized protein GT037_002085 [Alternaria burnsii]KAF7680434.1 hypothetical protein GT037_002085 [Alternaria burnsii]